MTDQPAQLAFDFYYNLLPPEERPEDLYPRWQPIGADGIQHGHVNLNRSEPCEVRRFYTNQFGNRMCARCWPLPESRLTALGYQIEEAGL